MLKSRKFLVFSGIRQPVPALSPVGGHSVFFLGILIFCFLVLVTDLYHSQVKKVGCRFVFSRILFSPFFLGLHSLSHLNQGLLCHHSPFLFEIHFCFIELCPSLSQYFQASSFTSLGGLRFPCSPSLGLPSHTQAQLLRALPATPPAPPS